MRHNINHLNETSEHFGQPYGPRMTISVTKLLSEFPDPALSGNSVLRVASALSQDLCRCPAIWQPSVEYRVPQWLPDSPRVPRQSVERGAATAGAESTYPPTPPAGRTPCLPANRLRGAHRHTRAKTGYRKPLSRSSGELQMIQFQSK